MNLELSARIPISNFESELRGRAEHCTTLYSPLITPSGRSPSCLAIHWPAGLRAQLRVKGDQYMLYCLRMIMTVSDVIIKWRVVLLYTHYVLEYVLLF